MAPLHVFRISVIFMQRVKFTFVESYSESSTNRLQVSYMADKSYDLMLTLKCIF